MVRGHDLQAPVPHEQYVQGCCDRGQAAARHDRAAVHASAGDSGARAGGSAQAPGHLFSLLLVFIIHKKH
jgi:hypothetical protein